MYCFLVPKILTIQTASILFASSSFYSTYPSFETSGYSATVTPSFSAVFTSISRFCTDCYPASDYKVFSASGYAAAPSTVVGGASVFLLAGVGVEPFFAAIVEIISKSTVSSGTTLGLLA